MVQQAIDELNRIIQSRNAANPPERPPPAGTTTTTPAATSRFPTSQENAQTRYQQMVQAGRQGGYAFARDLEGEGFVRLPGGNYVNPRTREEFSPVTTTAQGDPIYQKNSFGAASAEVQQAAALAATQSRGAATGTGATAVAATRPGGGAFFPDQAALDQARAAGGYLPNLTNLGRGLETLRNFEREGPRTYGLNQYDEMTRGGPGRAGFTNLIGGWDARTGGGSPFAPVDRRMFSDSYMQMPEGYGGPGGQDFYAGGEPSVATTYGGQPATLSTGTAGGEIRGGTAGGFGFDPGQFLASHGIAPSGDPLVDAGRATEIAENLGLFSFAQGGTLGVGRPGSSDPTIIGRTPGTGIPSPPNTGSLTPGPGPGGYTLFSQAAPVPDPVEPLPVTPPAPPPVGAPGGGQPGTPYYPPGWGPNGPLGPPVSGTPLPTPTAPLPTPVGPPALPPAPPPVSDYGAAAQNADYQQNLFGYRRAAGALPGMQAIQLAAGEVPTGPAPAGYYYRPYDEAASQRNQLEAWKQAPFGVNLSNYKQGLSAPFDLLMQAYMNQTNTVNQAPFNLAFQNYMNQQRDVTNAPWDLLMQEWYRANQAPTIGTSYGGGGGFPGAGGFGFNPHFPPPGFAAGGSLGYGSPMVNEGTDGMGGRKSMVVPERSLIVGTQTGTPYGEMSEAGAELLTDTGNRLRIDPMGGMGGAGAANLASGVGATPPTRPGTLPNVTPQEFSYLLKAAPDVATSLAQLDLALMRTGNAPTAQMEMALGKAESIADPNVRQRALGTYRNIVSRVNSMRMQPPDLSMSALPEDPVALAAAVKFGSLAKSAA